MAFDVFFLSAVLEEIRGKAIGGRVEKIHQPSRDTVIFHLRCPGGREKLLLAPNPAAPRLHLTATSPENPEKPPMFCMFLRKHLTGGILTEIRQQRLERQAEFIFSCIDEMGDRVEKKLVVELMGRTCNLYLLDKQGRILDCLRRLGLDEAKQRPALPGMFYIAPEAATKLHPLEADFSLLLQENGPDLLWERLMERVGGLSPLVCREAALFAGGDTEFRLEGADTASVAEKLQAFFAENIASSAPWYYRDEKGKIRQFAYCPIRQYGACEKAETFAALLDSVYSIRDKADAMRQKSQAVVKTVQNLCQRLQRKMANQQKELETATDRERLRQFGDIVTANLHRIQKGQKNLQAEDFYDEEMKTVEIPLSVTLSPQQNAAKYYKDYSRMKNAEKELTRQLSLGQQELSYLQSVLEELARADSEAELEEIRQELQQGGYIRADGKRKMHQAKLGPMRFVSTDGYPIFVGRNNRQNEELTFKAARKNDLWLHAQQVPGSHVIIACGGEEVPDDTVTQAAQLAAHYSESRGGQNLPVDVMPVRQVKKHPAGKPGMVIYHSHKTVIVNPYPDIVVDPLNAEKK